jgi:hypothetical protein
LRSVSCCAGWWRALVVRKASWCRRIAGGLGVMDVWKPWRRPRPSCPAGVGPASGAACGRQGQHGGSGVLAKVGTIRV